MKPKNKLSYIWIFFQKLFKRIKLRNLLFLAILMSCNSFAWFIYATKVSNNITAHVRSWKVNFIVGDNNIEETLTFDVESVYPGMPDSLQVINATNNSDTSATLSYEIVSASILGEEYVVSDTYGQSLTGYKVAYGKDNVESKTAGKFSINYIILM